MESPKQQRAFVSVHNNMVCQFVLRGLREFSSPHDQLFNQVHISPEPRTKSQLTIWSLPEEVMLHLMKRLPVTDILNLREVHPYFCDLIDSSTAIWKHSAFDDIWPSISNIKHFERAAKCGNIEACIKLGVAYLYNLGDLDDSNGRRVTDNGNKSAEMFYRAESLVAGNSPFTWLFIRPPWYLGGGCCKERVFVSMKARQDKVQNPSVMICIARTLALLEDEDKAKDSQRYLQSATDQGSNLAAFLLWEQRRKSVDCDPAGELESIRQLREIAETGHAEARLALCKSYVQGKYGGMHKTQAAAFVREFVKSSNSSNAHKLFSSNSELTPRMRYILTDWLVEVASTKDYSAQTLHVVINMIDRYLKLRTSSPANLQLLGVAAMVMCSRFLGRDIITIREAAWLTDNTYQYDDIVRMMGEIAAALKGNLREMTISDYLELFSSMAGLDRKTQCLTEMISELTLHHAGLGQYTSAEIAASSILLARVMLREETPWIQKFEEFTGLSIPDLQDCTRALHEQCFLGDVVVDHCGMALQATKQRYCDDRFHRAGEVKVITIEELFGQLGIAKQNLSFGNVKKIRRCVFYLLNESTLSAYEADREDEDSLVDNDQHCYDKASPRIIVEVSSVQTSGLSDSSRVRLDGKDSESHSSVIGDNSDLIPESLCLDSLVTFKGYFTDKRRSKKRKNPSEHFSFPAKVFILSKS